MADPSDPERDGAQQADGSGDTPETGPLAEGHPVRAPRRRVSAERLIAVAAVIALVVTASIVVVVQNRGAIGLQRPPNTNPLIAVVDAAGSTSLVDGTGHPRPLPGQANVSTGFPAWSPDGASIAIVGSGSDSGSISVYPVTSGGADPSPPATVVYRDASRPPFYAYWAPDGKTISFLRTEGDSVALLVAAADGSSPLDGGGPGAVVRRGTPLYYDWIDPKRLIIHVGSGNGGFLGEVALDGGAGVAAKGTPGDFRAPMISPDRRYVSFVRDGAGAGGGGTGELVVAARDGSVEHAEAVFGSTAAVFAPTGTMLASIARSEPGSSDYVFPVGPLRLLDPATGASRTLLDGLVLAFFWSPDARTIAAIRLEVPSGTTAAASPSPSAAPEPVLIFVDVATGSVRSHRPIRPGTRFVGEFLPYFDQYAQSHRLWAPDGSSIVIPITEADGTTRVVGFAPDGGDPVLTVDADAGFWSP